MTPAAEYAQAVAYAEGLKPDMESLILSAYLEGQQVGLKQAQVIVDEMFDKMDAAK